MGVRMNVLDLTRLQFAVVTIYHYFFVPLSISLAAVAAGLEIAWLRTGVARWRDLTKFVGKLLIVTFAVGVVTGLVQEFQFGLGWSAFARFYGDVFGPTLAIEGMLAFFLEATFLALWHFGWDRLPKAASESEISNHLLDRALRAQGVVSLDSACHLDAPRKPAVRNIIAARVRRKELVPIALDGAASEHWVRPETLDALPDPAEIVHILNPFDPLVIQRKRLALFFGYEHRFEAYVPKEKRVYGYFSQPVLVGDEIVAVLDLKTDRERGKLLVQKWTWIARGDRAARRRRIEDELQRFERFQLAK